MSQNAGIRRGGGTHRVVLPVHPVCPDDIACHSCDPRELWEEARRKGEVRVRSVPNRVGTRDLPHQGRSSTEIAGPHKAAHENMHVSTCGIGSSWPL